MNKIEFIWQQHPVNEYLHTNKLSNGNKSLKI